MTQDELKKLVAQAALKQVVDDAIVGVGSGSTVNLFIDALAGMKGRIEGAVAASEASAERLKKHGIRVFDLNAVDELPVYVDGADEVTEHLAMIKGGGGALTREKIVAAVARKFVCICDASKLVPVLGKRGRLPVEVVPFASPLVMRELAARGCRPALRTVDGKVFVTDNGNWIVDCGVRPIEAPVPFAHDLRAIPGVVETGLFLGIADLVLVAEAGRIRELRRGETRV